MATSSLSRTCSIISLSLGVVVVVGSDGGSDGGNDDDDDDVTRDNSSC